MAKTYSSTAPGAPVAARTRTTRQTRSQSAEPQESATRHASDRANSAEPGPGTRGRRRGKTAAATGGPDLPTVDEDESVADDEEEEDDDDDEEEEVQGDDTAGTQLAHEMRTSVRSASSGSAFSGTTAKTSFSQEEVEQMDRDILVDVLPSTVFASEHLAQLLLPQGSATPPELWKEIKRTGSKHNKLYNNRLALLNVPKLNFGTQEYIQPRIVLSALLGTHIQSTDDVQPALWRPDNMIFKINLVQMANKMLVTCDTAEWTPNATDELARLDLAFPEGVAGGEFKFASLELWLNLSAQLAIRRLELAIDTDPNFSALDEIDNVYFNEGTFKYKDVLGLNAIKGYDDYDSAMKAISDLIDALKAPFLVPGVNPAAANGKLKAQFCWEDFRDHLLRYYEARADELDLRLDAAGGIAEISQALGREVERRANEQRAEELKQQIGKPGRSPRKSLSGKTAMAALKAREKQVAQQAQAAAPTAFMGSSTGAEANDNVVVQDFGNDEQPGTGDEDRVPAIASSALAAVSAMQEQNKRKSKARFIDEQPGAVQIGHDMWTQETQPRSSAGAKRARVEMDDDDQEFDPTQDEGFETINQNPTTAEQRRKEVDFSQQPQQQRVPRARNLGVDSSNAAGPSTRAPPSPSPPRPSASPAVKRQRKNPGSTIPQPVEVLDPDDPRTQDRGEFYKRARASAKLNRVAAREAPIQIRQPWTEDEDTALIELIEEHCDDGISYATLKAIDQESGRAAGHGGMLARRKPEDIRFKARNMRMTMMLAGAHLPRNWEKVVLDKKAIEKLHARGIAFVQQRMRASREE